jgi:hypothetical protein
VISVERERVVLSCASSLKEKIKNLDTVIASGETEKILKLLEEIEQRASLAANMCMLDLENF